MTTGIRIIGIVSTTVTVVLAVPIQRAGIRPMQMTTVRTIHQVTSPTLTHLVQLQQCKPLNSWHWVPVVL